MVEPKSCHATFSHFNFGARNKSRGSLENSSPKRGDIPKKSMMPIIRPSSIVIMKDKNHTRRVCIMKESPPPLGEKSKIKGSEIANSHTS